MSRRPGSRGRSPILGDNPDNVVPLGPLVRRHEGRRRLEVEGSREGEPAPKDDRGEPSPRHRRVERGGPGRSYRLSSRWGEVIGLDCRKHFAGEATLQTPDDLRHAQPLGSSSRCIFTSWLVVSESDDNPDMQGSVSQGPPSAVHPVRFVLPELAGMGATPHRRRRRLCSDAGPGCRRS